MTTQNGYIIDVDARTFQQDVIQKSHDVPVVVDFWAPWCGPCRMLGPVLEQLAEEYEGQFILAKLNTDENQGIALQYGIQGIPAVKGFRDGKVTDEFVGVKPRPQVKQFIDGLLPSPEDEELAQARRLESQGLLEQAEAVYRSVLTSDPNRWEVAIDLGRVLVAQEAFDEAQEILEQVPQRAPEGAEAQRLLLEIELDRAAAGCRDEAECRARIEADPDDLDARYGLASLLVQQQRYDEALAEFLEILQRDRSYKDDAARKAMLSLFDQLGDSHELTQRYRSKLAMLLYA